MVLNPALCTCYFSGGEQAKPCCIFGDCHKQPTFGLIGTFGSQHAVYCAEHRDPDLHEVVFFKHCIYEGCKSSRSFGFQGWTLVSCSQGW